MVAREARLGRLAVECGYLRPIDLDRCVRAQRRLRLSGVALRLGQVMIQRDLISTSQLVGLLEIQRDRRGPALSGPTD